MVPFLQDGRAIYVAFDDHFAAENLWTLGVLCCATHNPFASNFYRFSKTYSLIFMVNSTAASFQERFSCKVASSPIWKACSTVVEGWYFFLSYTSRVYWSARGYTTLSSVCPSVFLVLPSASCPVLPVTGGTGSVIKTYRVLPPDASALRTTQHHGNQ